MCCKGDTISKSDLIALYIECRIERKLSFLDIRLTIKVYGFTELFSPSKLSLRLCVI
jgi:hypothetical protein